MKHTCPHCGNTFESNVEYDFYGWHTSCPACSGSFDVDYQGINFAKDVDHKNLMKATNDLVVTLTADAGWSVNNHGGYYSLAYKDNLELIVCVNKYKDNETPDGIYCVYVEVQHNKKDEIVNSWWIETKRLFIDELRDKMIELLLSEWWK